MLIVQKYGGSSVGSLERIRSCALRVLATQRAGHEVVVVARTSSVETLRESGFHLSSPVFGERVTRPDVVDRERRRCWTPRTSRSSATA